MDAANIPSEPNDKTKILIGLLLAGRMAHDAAALNGFAPLGRSPVQVLEALQKELLKVDLELLSGEPSDHFPDTTKFEETFADMIIIILDLAQQKNYSLATVITSKLEFNLSKARVLKNA